MVDQNDQTGAAGTDSESNTGATTSPNPSLDAASNSPAANPPAPGDEPRIVAPIDEVQKEVDGKGNVVHTRSLASAGQNTKDGSTGAPDGIGLGVEGAQGQEPPADTTAEADKSDEKKSDEKPKSGKTGSKT